MLIYNSETLSEFARVTQLNSTVLKNSRKTCWYLNRMHLSVLLDCHLVLIDLQLKEINVSLSSILTGYFPAYLDCV